MRKPVRLICWVAIICFCWLPALRAQSVRVMQWNVLKGVGREANITNAQARALARIVNYNQPDVIVFNEVDAQGLSAAQNEAAIIAWVTNYVPYLGTQPGVTFYVKASSMSDGFNRNSAVSRYPISAATTYNDGLRGLHSLRLQLAGTNVLQVFHAHFKCCNADSDCATRQSNAVFSSGVIRSWAATNPSPYIFAGDWNEDESNPQCVLSSTYRPITMVRTNGNLVEFIPTALNGDKDTISSSSPTRRFDYCLAGSNRLSAVSGHVFNSAVWGSQYTSVNPSNSSSDSVTASDHLCVIVNYSLPTSATNFDVTPPTAFASGGPAGGPFSPPSQIYTLTNSDVIPLFWSVTKTSNWLTVSPLATNLTLGAGRGTNITVSINSTANGLSPGTYLDTINFSNTATGVSFSRGVTLLVGANPPTANFSASPTNGFEPLVVTFSDTSTGTINDRFWNFGDGNTTNLTTNAVVHTYNAGGYTVTLIVSGVGGSDTNVKPNYVSVLTPFQGWQIQYFGSTNAPGSGAGDDPDGDGQTNMAEFLSGTNPTNSASAFRILSITSQGSNTLITWATAGGQTNILQGGVGDLDNNNPAYSNLFYDLSEPIVIPGSGDAVTNFLDNDAGWGEFSNWPARYYRVRTAP
jgi:PKD repeat protein/endonuclease/exonuclease/phosphatase family metal-dependent hydrolase